jgi:heat shock protein HslJ
MRSLGLIVAIVATALTSCTVSPSGPQLVGTSWVVSSVAGQATLADHQPTLRFEDGTLLGWAGCNHFSGAFTVTGNELRISQVAISTMACLDERVSAQEATFTAALDKVSQVATAADGLELRDASGTVLLSLTPPGPEPSPRPLTGTTWALTSIRTGQAASSVVNGSSVSLELSDSTYRGKACNSFGGTVRVDGASITFAAPRSTKMACHSADISAQESTVLGLLTHLTTWTISGTQLSLSAPDGSGLDFTAK